MIDYNLAKQLKDAGFANDPDVLGTQTGIGGGTTWLYGPKGIPSDDMAYVPTLSELIEACTKNCPCFKLRLKNKTWYADFDDDFRFEGSSPEEAVSNLWLELNKKI